jgi:hypothetical protein
MVSLRMFPVHDSKDVEGMANDIFNYRVVMLLESCSDVSSQQDSVIEISHSEKLTLYHCYIYDCFSLTC